jgi:alpha-tubulin suppressor-like RCC1 family protein
MWMRFRGATAGVRWLSTAATPSEAYVWGKGNDAPNVLKFVKSAKEGALGTGSSVKELLLPKRIIIENEEIVNISLGNYHSTFVTSSGKLFVSGSNESGQLGVDTKQTLSPVQVPDLPDDVVQAVCGGYHTAALTKSGEVYTWGWGGTVWNFKVGALGHGSRDSHKKPKKVEALNGVKIVQISAGKEHMTALSDQGILYVWGNGEHGRLGNGSSASLLAPDELSVDLFSGEKISQVAAGQFHGVALSSEGNIYTWGRNNDGQLGVGGAFDLFSVMQTPQRVDFSGADEDVPEEERKVVKMKAIATSDRHVVASSEDGQLFFWGDAQVSSPQDLSDTLNSRKIVKLAAGNHFSLAIDGNH